MLLQIIGRTFLWLVPLCTVLIFGIIGCGGDEDDIEGNVDGNVKANDWVGTWRVETVDGENYEQFFVDDMKTNFGEGANVSIIANRFTFNNDGMLESEFAFKVSGKIGDDDISGTLSLKGTGTYSLSGTNYTTTATRQEEGTGWFEGDQESFTEDDSGTWLKDGSNLTLNSIQGAVIVLKEQ